MTIPALPDLNVRSPSPGHSAEPAASRVPNRAVAPVQRTRSDSIAGRSGEEDVGCEVAKLPELLIGDIDLDDAVIEIDPWHRERQQPRLREETRSAHSQITDVLSRGVHHEATEPPEGPTRRGANRHSYGWNSLDDHVLRFDELKARAHVHSPRRVLSQGSCQLQNAIRRGKTAADYGPVLWRKRSSSAARSSGMGASKRSGRPFAGCRKASR